jgi:streptogramin lyase
LGCGALAIAALAGIFCVAGCSGGTTRASADTPAPFQFVGAWGAKGTDPGQLDDPASIATDMRGNVYIADPGSEYIEKFQPGGTPLLAFQYPRMEHPQSIAVDRGGAIYVSDPVRASVFVFLPDGTLYREIRLLARSNEENTIGVAVDDSGSVNVLDVDASKLYDFSPRFRLEHVWRPGAGTPGGSGRPTFVVSGPGDAIYVAGMAQNSLLRFDDGRFTSQISLSADPSADPPSTPVLTRIGDQFAISSNFVFLADPDGKTLHVWTLNGKPQGDFDISAQLGTDQRTAPPIAVTPMNDLLVLDTRQARVFRYHFNF